MDHHRARWATALLWVGAVAGLLAGCAFPGSVPTTVKIGLSAPFEGRHRDVGYEALAAVRLAVRQCNDAGGLDGRYLVEFVALNDFADADEAVVQARKMAVDPDVLGVIGGFSTSAAQASRPEYERLGLVFLAPPFDATAPGSDLLAQPDAEFISAYQELSGGAEPGAVALWAYGVATDLLQAMDRAARAEGAPTREGVGAALEGN